DKQSADFRGFGRGVAALVEDALHLLVIVAGPSGFVPAFLLQQRASPLRKIAAPMVLGVPRTAMHFDFFGWRVFVQILAEMDGSEPEGAGAIAIQERSIKETPKAALDLGGAEPAAVLAVGPGRHESGESAVLGALADLVLKPAGVHA